jgi:hypothetical protein
MLNKDNKRELAYVDTVHDIVPIAGADNIELVHVEAWNLIARKGEFKEGDKCVFFEIDSRLPKEDARFDFMEKKGYKVKTMKLSKFGVYSEGLALPLSQFPEIPQDSEPHTFVTDLLKVTYYDPEDNVRKSDPAESRVNSYVHKHKRFFDNKLVKFLMKFKFFRWLFLHNAKKKRASEKDFPSQYVSKTDEERVQNMPSILQNKNPWVVTEKVDGTSSTYLLVRKPFGRFEFYVCSRNVRMLSPTQETFNKEDNIYWENATRYHIEDHLKQYLQEHKDIQWVCIQGESYGEGWQNNPLKLKGHNIAVFNFKDSKNGRWGSLEGKKLMAEWGIPWVPIIHEAYILPDTVDELLKEATGPSTLNNNVLREGWVLRAPDGSMSFKAVSPEYLASKKD